MLTITALHKGRRDVFVMYTNLSSVNKCECNCKNTHVQPLSGYVRENKPTSMCIIIALMALRCTKRHYFSKFS